MRLALAQISLMMGLAVCGCATYSTVRVDQGPVQEPLRALETRAMVDSQQFLANLHDHGALYNDAALEEYLLGKLQPLLPALPEGSPIRFRVLIVRDPTVNAYTLANGDLYFNTGLIARLETAQQFAYIAGHEAAHVANRDVVYFMKDYSQKTLAANLAGLVITPVAAVFGVSGPGEAALSLAYAASVTGFGRERETIADKEGLLAMIRAGYNGWEAVRATEMLNNERKSYEKGLEIGFLSSHPENAARIRTLQQMLTSCAPRPAQFPADEEFLRHTHALRLENARHNIELNRCHHAERDLLAMLARSPSDPWIHYYLGEAYRSIAEDPVKLKREVRRTVWEGIASEAPAPITHPAFWIGKARDAYGKARQLDAALPQAHRGLGLLARLEGNHSAALESLQEYLALAPEAKDKRYVTAMIHRIQKQQAEPGAPKEANP